MYKRKHMLHMKRLRDTEHAAKHYTSYLLQEKAWPNIGQKVWPNIGQNGHFSYPCDYQ